MSEQSTWEHRQPIRLVPLEVSKPHSGQREASAAPWLGATQSTAALARWTQLAAASKTLVFLERARQGHPKHAQPKEGVKILLMLGGRPAREGK